jgi:hypothetical protein
MAYDRELLEFEKASILNRLFASKNHGNVTGTPEVRDVARLGFIERLLKKLRSADE